MSEIATDRMRKVKSILVTQEAPTDANSPYLKLAEKFKQPTFSNKMDIIIQWPLYIIQLLLILQICKQFFTTSWPSLVLQESILYTLIFRRSNQIILVLQRLVQQQPKLCAMLALF